MTGFAEPGASRDGYGDALLDMAGDERVVVLEADLEVNQVVPLPCRVPRADVLPRDSRAEHGPCRCRSGRGREGAIREHIRHLLRTGLRAVQERNS